MTEKRDPLYKLIESYADNLIQQNMDSKLEAHLSKLDIGEIENTKTTLRYHSVRLNPDGTPRVNELCSFLSLLMLDYSIPRESIKKARETDLSRGNSFEMMKLHKKAKGLFVDLKTSGEGGEILLYALVEYFLKIPQLITKMPLKTSAKMHFHGVDGIYYKTESSNVCIYFGESKMQKKIYDAANECFSSITKFISSRGSSDSANFRDLDLIRDNIDINDESTQNALLAYLDQDSTLNLNLELRGACFIGYDAKEYPTKPNELIEEILNDRLKSRISSWTKTIEASIFKNVPVESYVIELFAIPFPSVESFKEQFLKEIGI
tara:strand:- start:2939 stop:3901 length:963 start_codon:yes stop_codon:yes gene_type:complete